MVPFPRHCHIYIHVSIVTFTGVRFVIPLTISCIAIGIPSNHINKSIMACTNHVSSLLVATSSGISHHTCGNMKHLFCMTGKLETLSSLTYVTAHQCRLSILKKLKKKWNIKTI